MVWTGFGLAALGIGTYAVQVAAHRLSTPYYLPVAVTLGMAIAAAGLWRRRTVVRWLLLGLLILLSGAAWSFVIGTQLPAYNGPVAIGSPFPQFTTLRANGTPFSQSDLIGDSDTILVFFRGRW